MRADGRGAADGLSRGFPPVVGAAPRVLILGSLPGRKSLAERQYYAQPQNAFWHIMERICGAGPALEYPERLARLKASSIALWDVLAAGERPGSLDSAIVRSTIVSNDFNTLLQSERTIDLICFNGKTAAELYRRHVLPTLPAPAATLPRLSLPSTSPAHAMMAFDEKLVRWNEVLRTRIGTYS